MSTQIHAIHAYVVGIVSYKPSMPTPTMMNLKHVHRREVLGLKALLFVALALIQDGESFTASRHLPFVAAIQSNRFQTSFALSSVSNNDSILEAFDETASLKATSNFQLNGDVAAAADKDSPKLVKFKKYAQYFCNMFPIWTLITAGTALARPNVFLGIPPSTFPAQIGMLMLCMGISLRPVDFKRVAQQPMAVLLAFVGCYVVMPALAIILGKALALPKSTAAGLVLVACLNGAQASNLCTFIGQGDLALSVMMTTMTTIGAMVMTPLVGKIVLGTVVPVNSWAISKSTVQVVLAYVQIEGRSHYDD
jgi:hypothetical protein